MPPIALGFLHWLAHTPINAAMNRSVWAFAVIEMIHLLALAVLGGVVILVCVRGMGLWLKTSPLPRLVRASWPVFGAALAVALVSGALLMSSAPMKYGFNVAFQAKMALLILALAGYAAVSGLATRRDPATHPVALKAVSALTLALWLGVGVGGRLIGLI